MRLCVHVLLLMYVPMNICVFMHILRNKMGGWLIDG